MTSRYGDGRRPDWKSATLAIVRRPEQIDGDRLPLGVLASPPPGCWQLRRLDPAPALRPFVAWLWSVQWDLDQLGPHHQATLPHPSAHLVIEGGQAWIHGPTRHRFTRVLEGRGRVVAARFQPAGLRPFLDRSMRALVDQRLPAIELLPEALVDELVAQVDPTADPDTAMGLVESIVGRWAPGPEAARLAAEVNAVVERAAGDRSITGLAGLAAATGRHPRRLQRELAEHVGLGPKAIIRRHRLQEAAALALNEGSVDWAATAAELGYYDQAHLINDFRRTLGSTPARYARTARRAGAHDERA